MIGRRDFITLIGGAAALPMAAHGQQPERMRRIGVLLPATADDAEYQARVGAFMQGLALLGWTIGRNVRIDTHWGTPNDAEIRKHAAVLPVRPTKAEPNGVTRDWPARATRACGTA